MLLDVADVANALDAAIGEDLREAFLQVVDEIARLGEIEHAARDEVRTGDDARFLRVDGDDDHHDPVAGEVLAIAQHRFADVADPAAVDHHVAAVGPSDFLRALFGELHHVTVLGDEDVVARDAGLLRQVAVRDEHAILAVDRDEVFRPHEVEHQQQLFLRGMSRDVGVAARSVDHVGADAIEVVDRLCDRLLVAGDRRRRDHDRVARHDLELLVVAHREAAERRHRLALRTGRHHAHLFGRVLVDVFEPDRQPLGDVEIAKLARELHDVRQRATEERDLAVEALRLIDHLLDARHVGGERRDDDAAFGTREDVGERLADDALGERVAGPLGVGRVGEHQQDALVADPRDRREVGGIAVDRRLVELEVAGMEDDSERRADRQRAGPRQRVVDVDELRLDRAERDAVAGLDFARLPIARLVFLELRADQRQRERRSDDRNLRKLAQQIRDPADVVFVAVRDEQAAKLVLPFAQVGEVVDDDVDPEHLLVGKHQAAVDDDQIVVRLDAGHVAADLAAAAQWDNAQVGLARWSREDEGIGIQEGSLTGTRAGVMEGREIRDLPRRGAGALLFEPRDPGRPLDGSTSADSFVAGAGGDARGAAPARRLFPLFTALAEARPVVSPTQAARDEGGRFGPGKAGHRAQARHRRAARAIAAASSPLSPTRKVKRLERHRDDLSRNSRGSDR